MSFICACAMPQSKKDLQKFPTFEEDDCFCQPISPKYHTVVRYRYAAACPPSPNTLRGCVTKPSNSSISQYEYVTGLSLSSSPLCLFLRPLSISFFPPSFSFLPLLFHILLHILCLFLPSLPSSSTLAFLFSSFFSSFKEVCNEIFDQHFIQDSNPSGPLVNRLKYFRFRFRGDIRSQICLRSAANS